MTNRPTQYGQALWETLWVGVVIVIPMVFGLLAIFQYGAFRMFGTHILQVYTRESLYGMCHLPASYSQRHHVRAHRWLTWVPGFRQVALHSRSHAKTCTFTLTLWYRKIPSLAYATTSMVLRQTHTRPKTPVTR